MLRKSTHPVAHSILVGLEFEKDMYGVAPPMGFKDVTLEIAQHVLVDTVLGINWPLTEINGHSVSSSRYMGAASVAW